MMDYLNDDDTMINVSQGFFRRSYGVLRGYIGALYGRLVRIVLLS